ncbi:DUF2963 domain-containing protein [Candidatus Phytoplasma australiense]
MQTTFYEPDGQTCDLYYHYDPQTGKSITLYNP